MLSKRANVMYLEKCRVQMFDERVVYLTKSGKDIEQYFNIPERNTAFLLLGMGTSITQAAVRRLAESHVLVGFCGTGGSPPYAQVDFAFMNMESEYRPTEYMQTWAELWFTEQRRLTVARAFLTERIQFLRKNWGERLKIPLPERQLVLFAEQIEAADSTQSLLIAEAQWARTAYRHIADYYRIKHFKRELDDDSTQLVKNINAMLDQGNYIAYGFAATALSGLGISFMFPVLHGKTRRGALVFDLADVIKDAIVMPLAFELGSERKEQQEFRQSLIQVCMECKVLDYLFGFLKQQCKKSQSKQ